VYTADTTVFHVGTTVIKFINIRLMYIVTFKNCMRTLYGIAESQQQSKNIQL